MSAESYKYLLLGLFSFVVIGSFYLVFKNGFKLEKRDKSKPLFKSKKQLQNDYKEDVILDTVLFAALLLFIMFATKCSN